MAPAKQRSSSYPANLELAPSFSSPDLLQVASPPTTLSRVHKHSLSKPMAWLNRSASSISGRSSPLAALKPSRISEPRVGSSLYQFNFHRSGLLGSGATIVRTPQEALSGSSRTFELINEEQAVERDVLPNNHTEEKEGSEKEGSIIPPRPPSPPGPPSPPSPPLPPLPNNSDAAGGEGGERGQSASPTSIPSSDRSSDCTSTKTHRFPSRPTILPSRAPSRLIPALSVEADVSVMPPQHPFEASLLSTIPDSPIDPSKVIVTLETCTTTYRTSLRTLISRPSHLSHYVTSLLSPVSETASIYSNASDTSLVHDRNGFNTAFRDHLASSGCLPQSANAIHVFLDRPSAPYTHVLAYLRSLPGTPDKPETLPRGVQHQPGPQSSSSLDALLELCDEANYLGLEALHKLCCQEINRVPRGPFPTSGGTLRSKTGSVRSFRTLVDQHQPHQEVRPPELRASKGSGNARTAAPSATRGSTLSLSCENKDLLAVQEPSRERRGQGGSPPPGWI